MFPAETTASAVPSATARTAATSELSGFAADRLGRLLVHLDHAGRLAELEPARLDPGVAEEHGNDRVARGLEGSCNDLGRPAIAAHRVDRDADHGATGRRYGAARPRGRLYVPQVAQR